jgi:hypothetical protein
MWRSAFLALGIVLGILGAECLVMEKAVLASDRPLAEAAGATASIFMATPDATTNEIKPPDWAPWTLMSCGAVVILYSYTFKRNP